MKHTAVVTLLMLLMFFGANVFGLFVVHSYVDLAATMESGTLTYHQLPFQMERPEIVEKTSFIYIMIAVLIATAVALLIIKLKFWKVWKIWYLLAVWLTSTVALAIFINNYAAIIISAIIALIKVYRPHFLFHNVSEALVYAGIAAMIVPVMDIFAVIMLLLFISVYDVYAVFKSKHMVTLAEAQQHTKVFAGFTMPYHEVKGIFFKPRKVKTKTKGAKKGTVKQGKGKVTYKTEKIRIAILGGGDVAFCLLFSGVVLKHFSFAATLLVPFCATIALGYLFCCSKKNKYYPAMPFVTAGCLLGYGILFFLF